MGLYSDVEFMLRRSGESRLKVERVLKSTLKSIKSVGETAVYSTFSPTIKHNLCCARILQRDFRDWDGWQFRDAWAVAMRNGVSSIPFWDGSPVRRLIVIGEQGVGDEVLFASLLPEAMGRCESVTYACDERLVMPLARSLPGLHTKTRYVDARDDLIGGYDAFIPAADLLPLFRRAREHFPRKPFLKPDPSRVAEFEQYRGRVGVSWKGRHGSVNPMALGIDNPLSLQYNATHEGVEIPHLDLRNDLEGVIALCSVLSKVVTVPTSVWHFASAVGTPTDVILADKGTEFEEDGVVDQLDWHCPEGLSPWYARSEVFSSVKKWRSQ